MVWVNKSRPEAPSREERKEWLLDRVTQMGHDPDDYEKWYAELDRIKQVEKEETYVGEIRAELPTKDVSPKHWKQKFDEAMGCFVHQLSDAELTRAHLHLKAVVNGRRTARKEEKKRLKAKEHKAKMLRYKKLGQESKKEAKKAAKKAEIAKQNQMYADEIRKSRKFDRDLWMKEEDVKTKAIIAAGFPEGKLPPNSDYVYVPSQEKVVLVK